MTNKHKHYYNHNEKVKEQEKKFEEETELENEEEKTPAERFPNEEEELSPPQDLNLKLQIEKENSIALTNMLKQLQADFENFRKRNANVKQEAYKDGVFDALKRMMNCYDAIEGALNSIEDEQVKSGLEILKREFLAAFAEFEITPIEALGEMFDANLHNAISSEEKEGAKSGIVTKEIQKGFKSPEKVLRYSLVVIAK